MNDRHDGLAALVDGTESYAGRYPEGERMTGKPSQRARGGADGRKRAKAAKASRATRAGGMPIEYGETAMSREFARRFVNDCRFVSEFGWLWWDGSRWTFDVQGRARLAAKGLCDDFAEYARHDPLFGEEEPVNARHCVSKRKR